MGNRHQDRLKPVILQSSLERCHALRGKGLTATEHERESHPVPRFDNLIHLLFQAIASRLVRGTTRRTVRFFFSCSLVPLFFYVPLLSRCCPGCCPAAVPAIVFLILIFAVVTDGYDKPAVSRFRLDHCLGFQPGQKPINSAFRPAPLLAKLAHRRADLAALKRHHLAVDVELRWTPARLADQPEPCAKTACVALEKRVVKHCAVGQGKATHARGPAYRGLRKTACVGIELFIDGSFSASWSGGGLFAQRRPQTSYHTLPSWQTPVRSRDLTAPCNTVAPERVLWLTPPLPRLGGPCHQIDAVEG